ncbi:MAG: tRNA 2-thiouridine(34) synthase MnmA [Bacteroidales bacterium]|nr:tRNA 2-thiouridine(34) synthase MnmA [Bacteroidales bacterium]
MKKKVVVGLSGGVDSSVAAYLLKKEGYDVTGLFMINWHDTTGTLSGDCPWNDDLIFAELVARKLEIPFHKIDFSEQYRKRVVDYMFAEYEKGRTPNPDVLCNREVKFDLFVKAALDLDADFIATGHYCRKEETLVNGKTVYRLLAGSDPNKDQSYFLCQLSQQQLSMALFPIGHLIKQEVRKIAQEQKLPTAAKKDSQGICFVGKVSLPDFLQQKLKAKKGVIIEINSENPQYKHNQPAYAELPLPEQQLEQLCSAYSYTHEDGKIVGKHNGAHFFTIGQNKGLNIGGRPEQSFVIATDVEKNIIYTGNGQNHPGLFRKGLFIPAGEIHWLRNDLKMLPGENRDYVVRIRYRQNLQKATLYCHEKGIYILFEKPQRGITPGQFAAWYDGEELLGSGVIE